MRYVIFAFLYIAIVLVSSSCQNTKNHTVVHIDLNGSHSQPSIEIEQIIPLETSDEAYISFNFSLFGQDNFMIYSKETGKYYYSADLFNADLLPISRLNNALSPIRFLAFAQPENIIQFANAKNSYELPGGVSILDNPCLIIFSLVEN